MSIPVALVGAGEPWEPDLVRSLAQRSHTVVLVRRSVDVADAMAEYWVSNWVMANRRPDPTAGQVRAARDQVRRMLASSPALARLDLDLRALVLTDRGLAERG